MQIKNRVIGLRETVKMLKQDRVISVTLANNADDEIIDEILSLCNKKGIKVERVRSKEKLGRTCGIERPAAVVAYLKIE